MKGRLYDADVRRFVTADPFVTEPFDTQGINPYSYVGNNPINFVDPSGFQEQVCTGNLCAPGPDAPVTTTTDASTGIQTHTFHMPGSTYDGGSAPDRTGGGTSFGGSSQEGWAGPPSVPSGAEGPSPGDMMPMGGGSSAASAQDGAFATGAPAPLGMPADPGDPGRSWPGGTQGSQSSEPTPQDSGPAKESSPGWQLAQLGGGFLPFVGSLATIADPNASDEAKGEALVWLLVDAATLGIAAVLKGGAKAAARQIDDAASAATTVGRRGQQVNFPNPNAPVPRNAPGTVGGREFSGHAFDRMQERGFVPSVVENAIQHGTTTPGTTAGTLQHFDPVNKFNVITDAATGRVITVY